MERVAGHLRNILDFSVLSNSKEGLDLKNLQEMRTKTIISYKEIEPAIAFLPLDFSVGLWNADDVKSLKGPMRGALLAGLALLQFHISWVEAATKMDKLQETPGRGAKADAHDKNSREVGEQQLTETLDMVRALQSPEDGVQRSATVEALKQSSMEILSTCQDALSITIDCIHTVNSAHWFARPSEERFHQLLELSEMLLRTLTASRASFASDTTERLLETCGDTFDESGRLKPIDDHLAAYPLRGIMLGIVFEERILGVADALQILLAQIIALLQRRTRPRVWFPTGLRYAMAWVFKKSVAAPIPGQSRVIDPDVVDKLSKRIQRQLHISHGYRIKQRSRLGKIILGTYHWLINAEGLYALRMVVITIALAIPAVISTSAGFYYREKCIWGLIMGQTTLLVYMNDLIFSIISGTVGTVVGGVFGLVTWYIGSGDGSGNPYGLTAMMAFTLAIIMWGRLFFPPAILQAVIMSGSTCLLIIGYSFDDT